MASPKSPETERELDKPLPPDEDKPGTNATQHDPNPDAEPIANGTERFLPSSPYTTGNS